MANFEVNITGMTCGHCVMSVTEELSAIGADEVAIDLVKDGVSTARITAPQPLTDAQVEAAVAEAGYSVAGITQLG